MQCAMQMCHSESRAAQRVVSTAPVAGWVLPIRGHAMVYLDPVSGNCIFSKLSACEMLRYSWAKQGMTIDSESALLCRRAVGKTGDAALPVFLEM